MVYALAHATGKVGRFTLIERWRNNERLLSPNENPLKILLKWGEYASDVQFILQRSDQIKKEEKQRRKSLGEQQNLDELSPLDRAKEIRKSFGLENVGIVKPTPSAPKEITDIYAIPNKRQTSQSPASKPDLDDIDIEDSLYQTIKPVSNISNEINLADVRDSLSRKTTTESSTENLLMDTLNGNTVDHSNSPLISSNGALVPPPYRNPPPPRNSPLATSFNVNNNNNEFLPENLFQGAQYTDLVQVIKFQREKINTQQSELSKVRIYL